MAMTDPFEPARRRKRRIGWYLVAVGAFLALRELVEDSPITWGWYWIVSNPKRPF